MDTSNMTASQKQMYEKGLQEGVWDQPQVDFFFQGDVSACLSAEENEYQERMQTVQDDDEKAYWLGRLTGARQSLQKIMREEKD